MEIGVDTGGTFTDIVCRVPGEADRILKVPSTPDDPSRAVLDGVRQVLAMAGGDAATIARVVHGTTVATNSVLQRKGAVTGLITSAGFRDVLEIGRQIRTAIYELELSPETPVFLAPGARRRQVAERLAADGSVVTPLDEAAVIEAADALVAAGCEAVAICFLFSFLNPAHEQRARDLIAVRHPRLSLSLSSEVDPAFREYERTVVTAFDAYTKPVLSQYLRRMAEQLAGSGVRAPLQVMQSRGGVSAAATAASRPVRLFLSGPAAGVIGGGHAARATGARDVITVDIGGTSCDIALISEGKPLVRPEGIIDGYAVRVPMVDVNAIGSGGGSLAWLDAAGGLRVGPDSAGADPGPACYGRGGERPTVTDASLVLGFLDPGYFAGGTLSLDAGLARAAIQEHIAGPLGMSVEQAAHGIHRVLNAQMAEGMRLVSIRQGFDPRDFALVPLGGGGAVHAIPLARELGIDTVVVPRSPGVLSAAGLLLAPIEHEASRGFPVDLADTSLDAVRETLAGLDARCTGLMAAEDVTPGEVRVSHAADVCYVGQSHYLEVPVDLSAADPLGDIYQRFIQTHEQVFGYSTASPARLVNLRSVHQAGGGDDGVAAGVADGGAARRDTGQRSAIFDDASTPMMARVLERAGLAPGDCVDGPAIIEQPDTTTVLFPGWQARTLDDGSLAITQRTSQK
jgi:N-methylhydantoinase A